MKLIKSPFPMSSGFLMAALLLAMAGLFSSCNEDSENNPTPTVEEPTEEEALLVVEGSLAASTEGMASEVEDATYLADEYSQKDGNAPCGVPFDTTITSSISNANLTADYTIAWGWAVICNNVQLPVGIDYTRSTSGTYETARMASNDSASGSWSVSNLLQGSNYILEGAYTRQGSQQSKVHNQSSFSSELSINVETLNIDKGTKRIQSGVADFALTLSSPDGNTYAFGGDIIFNGNGSATVIINGNSYTIML